MKRRWNRLEGSARLGIAFAATVLVLLAGAATALAIQQLRAGELVVDAEGGFAPKTLPRHVDAPITIHGGGSISTASGALPPTIKVLAFLFDRHGSVVTTGLPICTVGRLQATTTAAARKACPDAIVGEGEGEAVIAFPEQPPITLSTPLILFNGPPKGGDPTLIAHAYLSSPVSATYLIPIVVEKIDDGGYGYRTIAKIPSIAGGAGIPVSGHLKIGKTWTYKGKEYSYINARCETGKLKAKGEFTFKEGTRLEANFLKPCRVGR
jgi:hypothetical protein